MKNCERKRKRKNAIRSSQLNLNLDRVIGLGQSCNDKSKTLLITASSMSSEGQHSRWTHLRTKRFHSILEHRRQSGQSSAIPTPASWPHASTLQQHTPKVAILGFTNLSTIRHWSSTTAIQESSAEAICWPPRSGYVRGQNHTVSSATQHLANTIDQKLQQTINALNMRCETADEKDALESQLCGSWSLGIFG